MNLAHKIAGKNFPQYFWDNANEVLGDPEQKWTQMIYNAMDRLHPNIVKQHVLNMGFEAGLTGFKKVRENREKYGCNVPWVILMDPTSACNLKCTGCWAAEYGHQLQLSNEELDRIITEAKELGIHFFVLTGGEPMVRKKDILMLAEKHNDCAFHIFTNGTLIDEELCKEVQRLGNLSFALSVEGYAETNDDRRGQGVFEKVMHAMDLMKEHGLLFGTSICYTRANIEAVTSDEFLRMISEKGARFGFYFHYMPVGNNAVLDLMPTMEQREYMIKRIREIRSPQCDIGFFPMDFQNDGEFVGGCIAGGRNYFHINANGDAEPCVFIHYSGANIRTHSLLEILKQPLFMAYRDRQPFNENHLRPCPMLENPEILQQMVKETGAKSTDLQSPEDVTHLCGKCEEYARKWKPCAERLWAEEKHKKHSYENYKKK